MTDDSDLVYIRRVAPKLSRKDLITLIEGKESQLIHLENIRLQVGILRKELLHRNKIENMTICPLCNRPILDDEDFKEADAVGMNVVVHQHCYDMLREHEPFIEEMED